MKSKPKILLVGCGYIASLVHLPLLTSFNDVEVVGVVDSDKEKAYAASKIFGIKNVFLDVETAIKKENPDIIDICTPPKTHSPIAKLALEQDINCIIEKPLTDTVAEADEIISAQKKSNANVFPMHTYSYLPCFRKAKTLFDDGSVGELKTVETKYLVNFGAERYVESSHWVHNLPGGILFSEITPHLVMILLDYLGNVDSVNTVVSKLSDVPYVTADELHATLKSSNRLGTLGLSYNSPIATHRLTVVGKSGVIDVDSSTQTVVFHKPSSMLLGPTERIKWFLSESLQRTSSFGSTGLNTLIGRYRMVSEGHRFLMRKCIDNIKCGEEFPVSLEKSREVVRILEIMTNQKPQTIQA